MSVSDRLGRLLFIVPYVTSREEVPLSELAAKLGVSRQQIEADINLLSMVGQPPLTPDHLIDLYIEDDMVYIELDQSLSRPLALTHEEGRALVLGAKLVGDLGGLGSELKRVIERITAELPDREVVESLASRVSMDDESGPETHAQELRKAIDSSHRVRVRYYSQSSDALKDYLLEPLALITHGGIEYLVALDVDKERHEKLFRLDRLGEVEVSGEDFERPEDIDLERFRKDRLYFGDGALSARVRFSADVAHRAAERYPPQDVEKHEDGSIDVRISTSSVAWLARWVLPFGASAEVLGPPSARQYMRELCEEAALVYERER